MRRAVLLSLALLVAACRPAPAQLRPSRTPDRPSIGVALVAATPGPSESEATRAMQGARLAFDLANEQELLPVDIIATAYATGEDPAQAAADMRAIRDDPETVAAVLWPGGAEAQTVRDGEGLAEVDVSPVGTPGSGAWSRLVGTDAVQAEALAGLVQGRRACVAGDDGERGTALADMVAERLMGEGVAVPVRDLVVAGLDSYASLVARVRDAGCQTLVWTGGAVEAAEILEKADGAFRVIGTDRLLNDGFLDSVGELGDGTIATCPCGDIATSTDLDVQRFVQEYQSRYGTAPGAYAVEGWDAAQLLIDTIATAGTDRTSIAEALDPPFEHQGLIRDYYVGRGGESSPPITVQEVRGGAWVPRVER